MVNLSIHQKINFRSQIKVNHTGIICYLPYTLNERQQILMYKLLNSPKF